MSRVTARLVATLIAIATFYPAPTFALSKADYDRVGVNLPANAAVPGELSFIDEQGNSHRLGQYLTRPTVLVPAVFTCRTLCGPTLDFVVSALQKTGLKPDQYRVLVVSIDPNDTASDGQALRDRNNIEGTPLNGAITFARISTDAREQLTKSLGYSYIYDTASAQYIHPEAAFILKSDGRVSRLLNGIGFSSDDLRLALVEASNDTVGNIQDKVRLICSAFDPSTGTYNVLVQRVLEISSAIAIAIMFVGLSSLFLMERFARRP